MTTATPCTDRLPAVSATRAHRSSRFATLFARLADRVERGAQLRARRKAMRMTQAELQRLPDETLEDLGVGRSGISPLVSGLVGPPEYWRGFTRGPR